MPWAALAASYTDTHAHRFRQAWERLSPDAQAHWGSFEAFRAGAGDAGDRIGTMTDDRDTLCGWLTITDGPLDYGDADLARAWLIEVTRGPGSGMWWDDWIVAPLLDGSWGLWQVR